MNFSDYGIHINTSEPGEVRTTCPQCTPGRKPSHQKEKDLSVNVPEGTWFCHHCGFSGGLKKNGVEYHKPEYKKCDLPDNVCQWFEKRGISKNTLIDCQIGYEPGKDGKQGAIMFPRFKGGEVVAIKYRTSDKRMWQSKNPEPCFYNYDMANVSTEKTLIITEGEVDALSFIEAGFRNVVSVPDGAPPVNAKNIENKLQFLNYPILQKFDNFIIAVDNDEPGKCFEETLSDCLGKFKCLRCEYPGGAKDINDVLKAGGPEVVKDVIKKAKHYPIEGLYTSGDIVTRLTTLYEKGFRRGDSTGFLSLDPLYTVRPCEFTIVTGMPGSGKSTWLDAMMVNLNQLKGWKIAYCSPETWPVERHSAAIMEKIVRKPFDRDTKHSKRMNYKEFLDVADKIDYNFFFTEPIEEKMSVPSILEIMQAAIDRHGVNGIVLDPWNEIESHRPTDISETEYISKALGMMRRFTRQNNVHLWLVAHPMKMRRKDDGSYPVPRMYDIAGSAHFYNKADNGISIHRPDPTMPVVDVYVQKIRFREVGRLGSARLKYIYDCGCYKDLTDTEAEQYKQDDNEF